MHKRLPLWLLLLALGALVPLQAQTPAATPAAAPDTPVISAQIVATRVTGTVMIKLDDQTKPLANNDTVPQHAVVSTGNNSSVVLVFSNGATTQLGKNTELAIDEFLQDPFAATINPATLDKEPTISRTKLRLTHGELIGNVKHLDHARGSSFTVQTPVGAAGIRGTVFQIVFIPTGDGRWTFELTVPQGNVGFAPGTAGTTTTTTVTTPAATTEGTTTTTTTGDTSTTTTTTTGTSTSTTSTATTGGTTPTTGTSGVSVGNGGQITVLVDVTTTPTGQLVATTTVPITAPTGTANASLTAALVQAAQTMATVAQTTNFQTATGAVTTSVTGSTSGTGGTGTTTTTTTSTTTTTTTQGTTNTGSPPAQSTQTTTTITQASPGATTTITLTPGAGKPGG